MGLLSRTSLSCQKDRIDLPAKVPSATASRASPAAILRRIGTNRPDQGRPHVAFMYTPAAS